MNTWIWKSPLKTSKPENNEKNLPDSMPNSSNLTSFIEWCGNWKGQKNMETWMKIFKIMFKIFKIMFFIKKLNI